MKNIKSLGCIEALKGTSVPEKVLAHISEYFKWMMKLLGNGYNPQELGWIILLEKGDPLQDVTFLEENLGIRGGRTLVSIDKEFVDYSADTNFFEVFARYNNQFGIIYLIPNEDWLGEELLNHLRTFKDDPGNNSDQRALILQ